MMPRRSKSPSRSQSLITAKSIKFCHYKNGMFMGQMKCFERSGKGIVFLDTGEVAIASYEKDKLQGETLLITKNNVLYSLIFEHDNLSELAARSRDKLLYVRLRHGQPEGQATMIDFEKEEVVYAVYKQGRIIKKAIEQDSVFLNRVFSHNNISTLIPIHHLKMLNFEFKFPFLEVMRKNSLITIGFHKQGTMNGLGFVLFKDNEKQNSFYELLEKGYYKESLLSGIGQKRYQNGNLYIGEFKNNVFQGRGLLFNTLKNNWVKGMFKDGNLIDMIEYSNEGNSNSPKIIEMLSSLHRKKSSWVNSDIKFQSEIKFATFLERQVQNFNEYKGVDILDYQERKEIVLKRIQNNFVPSNNTSQADIMRLSSSARWDVQKTDRLKQKRKNFNPLSTRQQDRILLSPSPTKSTKSKSKITKTKKPDLFKIKSSNKTSQHYESSRQVLEIEPFEQEARWKNKTSEIPVNNIYTFEESSQSPRFSPSQSKHSISNTKKFNFSMNQHELSQPRDHDQKRSISASRRHKIFQNSPSRVNSSRIGFPSPSKSSIRQSHKNYEQSSVSDVLQEIKYPVRRSNKMVKSRVFEADAKQEEELPSFRYSRFKPEEEKYEKRVKFSERGRYV